MQKNTSAAGAKKVVLSAPAKDDSIPTYVMGVNHDQLQLIKQLYQMHHVPPTV